MFVVSLMYAFPTLANHDMQSSNLVNLYSALLGNLWHVKYLRPDQEF